MRTTLPPEVRNPHGVKVGQVWQDNDRRMGGAVRDITAKSGRYLRVIGFTEADDPSGVRAIVEPVRYKSKLGTRGMDWELHPWASNTRISLLRFKPNSTGYRLVKDVD